MTSFREKVIETSQGPNKANNFICWVISHKMQWASSVGVVLLVLSLILSTVGLHLIKLISLNVKSFVKESQDVVCDLEDDTSMSAMTLHRTGVWPNHELLPTNGLDLHWQLTIIQPLFAQNDNVRSEWESSPNSRWVCPSYPLLERCAMPVATTPVYYSTSFFVSPFIDPATVNIGIQIAVEGALDQVILNGDVHPITGYGEIELSLLGMSCTASSQLGKFKTLDVRLTEHNLRKGQVNTLIFRTCPTRGPLLQSYTGINVRLIGLEAVQLLPLEDRINVLIPDSIPILPTIVDFLYESVTDFIFGMHRLLPSFLVSKDTGSGSMAMVIGRLIPYAEQVPLPDLTLFLTTSVYNIQNENLFIGNASVNRINYVASLPCGGHFEFTLMTSDADWYYGDRPIPASAIEWSVRFFNGSAYLPSFATHFELHMFILAVSNDTETTFLTSFQPMNQSAANQTEHTITLNTGLTARLTMYPNAMADGELTPISYQVFLRSANVSEQPMIGYYSLEMRFPKFTRVLEYDPTVQVLYGSTDGVDDKEEDELMDGGADGEADGEADGGEDDDQLPKWALGTTIGVAAIFAIAIVVLVLLGSFVFAWRMRKGREKQVTF